jgi:hypothetical protein
MRPLFLLSTLALASCVTNDANTELDAEAIARGGGAKVDICHTTGSGTNVINVSTSAVAAHLAHGDNLAGAYYPDVDGDGFGDSGVLGETCPASSSDVTDNTDCDDGDASANPSATETAYDGIDNDCDAGTPDDDLDGDGYDQADDCDDTDAARNLDDVDADGYSTCDGDWDDTDASSYPGAPETCEDGIDNNGDGNVDEDCSSGATGCPCADILSMDDDYGSGLVSSDFTVGDYAGAVDAYDYDWGTCRDTPYAYGNYYSDYRWYQRSSYPDEDAYEGSYMFFATWKAYEGYSFGSPEGTPMCLFYAYDDAAGWSVRGGDLSGGWNELTDDQFDSCNAVIDDLIDTQVCYHTF